MNGCIPEAASPSGDERKENEYCSFVVKLVSPTDGWKIKFLNDSVPSAGEASATTKVIRSREISELYAHGLAQEG